MGDFIYGMLAMTIATAVIFGWCFALFDMLFRSDLSGIKKVVWVLAILFLPILGTVLYFLLRPSTAMWWAPGDKTYENGNIYGQSSNRVVGDVEMLARLREEGTITDDEFVRMKQRVMT